MSNQGEYPEDNRVGKHEPHDLSLTRRDLIKVSAATAATAVVYPHSTLAASVPAATPAPEIMPLTLKVNGKTEQLEVDTRTTLLDTLRENLHLIGTKKGCDHGQCGACTVLVNGRRLNACLTLAVMHQGLSRGITIWSITTNSLRLAIPVRLSPLRRTKTYPSVEGRIPPQSPKNRLNDVEAIVNITCNDGLSHMHTIVFRRHGKVSGSLLTSGLITN